MEKDESIFIAGHRGLVGSAILRKLSAEGFTGLLTRTRAELALTNRRAVKTGYSGLRGSESRRDQGEQ